MFVSIHKGEQLTADELSVDEFSAPEKKALIEKWQDTNPEDLRSK